MRGLTPYPAYRESGVAWVDHVPGHWRIAKVKHLVDDMRAGEGITSERIEPSGTYPVYGGNGLRGFCEAFTHDGTFILIGRQGALCGNVHMAHGRFWASEHALVAKPSSGTDARWLAHLLEVMDLGQYSLTAAQPGIGVAQIARLGVPIPPPAEQRAIADFLDWETGQIDRLIEKQEQLIDTLRERRNAVVENVLWNGLEGAEQDATEIGPVPTAPRHWLRLRNKELLRERQEVSPAGTEELLTVSHLTGVTPRSQKDVNMFEAESLEGYRIVQAGDLVINTMWAWMGALGISRYDGIVSPAYGVYRVERPDLFEARFFDYLYRSRAYVTEMTRFSRGIWSSRLRLYPESFLRLWVVVPPVAEQRAIADHLDDQTGRIDVLIGRAERFIGLARERRAALVSAAVTGRIDVRGAV